MRRALSVAAILSFVLLVLSVRLLLPDALVEDTLRAIPPDAHAWGVPLLAVAFIVATVALLPTSPLAFLAGTLLGPVVGFATIMVAAVAGGFVAFVLGRRASGFARRLLEKRAPRVLRMLDAHGLRAVIAARMPIFPFGPMSYGLGIAGVTPAHFALGTLVGAAPGAFLLVALGAALGDTSRLMAPGFLAPFALALAITLSAAWHGGERAPAPPAA